MTSDIRNALYGAFIFFQFPISGAFLTAGSGMERNQEAGYRITIADVIADGGKANSSKKTCAGIFFTFKEPGNRL